jgi:Tfp pilus assembly protein PilO
MRTRFRWIDIYLLIRTPKALCFLASLLCLIAAWLLTLSASTLRAEAEQLRATAKARAMAARSEPSRSVLETNNEIRLQKFASSLISREESPGILLNMWKQAEAAGVAANHADYRLEPDVDGGFSKMLITMPVGGSYQSLKKYAFSLLAKYPGLALNKLEIKAAKSGEDVEAELSFTLFLREP